MSRPQRSILTHPRIVHILALTFALVLSGLGSGVASMAAQSASAAHKTSVRAASTLPMIPPVMSCAALMQHDFGDVPEAPTSILSASVVAATSTTPEYCDVNGYISPQTQFELKLPTRTYQGRYLQVGCGGFCGTVRPTTFPPCDVQLGGDFAIATDDQGHMAASTSDGVWALDDLQLRIEFGYLSEHAMAQAAKAIIATFYGQLPHYTYFNGCSDGGHEALQEAQRYPDDFNGIIAGAPANIWAPLLAEFEVWDARANLDADGHQILTADKLPALHAAVMKACAGIDLLIDDPRTCHFDPASIQCPNGMNTATCLTPAQVETVRKLYEGPVDAQGRHLYIGGEPYGSELAWAGPAGFNWIVTPPGVKSSAQALGDNYLKYMAFQVGKMGPSFQDWQFTVAGFNALRPLGKIYNSANADLSAFHAHGGKLIIWQGWADQAIAPFGTPVYYDAVLDRMGGLQQVQKFARLFMFPGMYHCSNGYGPDQFDVIAPMVAWVEQGTAPSKIIATQTSSTGQLVRTFPVFPYPEQTKYTGHGSINDAKNYVGVMPSPLPDDDYNWVGNDLFNAQEGDH